MVWELSFTSISWTRLGSGFSYFKGSVHEARAKNVQWKTSSIINFHKTHSLASWPLLPNIFIAWTINLKATGKLLQSSCPTILKILGMQLAVVYDSISVPMGRQLHDSFTAFLNIPEDRHGTSPSSGHLCGQQIKDYWSENDLERPQRLRDSK